MTPDVARSVVSAAPRRALPSSVLLCRPDGYRIAYAINPHMRDAAGRLRQVDPARARLQWEGLASAYRAAGLAVEIIAGDPSCPDMVFAANQTLPFRREDGSKAVLLSNMHAPERRPEVAHFEAWFKSRGFDVRRLPGKEAPQFEGHGDFLWHPGRRVLFGGFGFRTAPQAPAAVAAATGIPVVPLLLVDPRFYHLDTCFMPLDDHRALLFRPALDAVSQAVVAACFEDLIEPPEEEACSGLACNADTPDGRTVVVERSCTATIRVLSDRGFAVVPLDLSEFLKAGGSAFCMKQALP
jgi:N-dimethylarginine dimethylaminohydrolase